MCKKISMLQLTLDLLLTTGLLSVCVAETFHVAPTLPAAQSCPQPCHTLDQYAQNTSLFAGHTEISLVFLEGVHNLTDSLIISGLDLNSYELEFRGQGAVPGDTVINLLSQASIHLKDLTCVYLINSCVFAENNGIIYQNVRFAKHHLMELTSNSFFRVFIEETITTALLHGVRARLVIQDSNVRNLCIYCRASSCTSAVYNSNIDNFIVDASSVRIQNSHLIGSFGIRVTNPKKLVIRNSGFQADEVAIGIYVTRREDSVDMKIQNCTIFSGKHAVVCKELDAYSNLQIRNCTIVSKIYGVFISQAGNVLIQNTIISECSTYGLLLDSVNNGRISECSIKNNTIGMISINSRSSSQNTNITKSSFGLLLPAIQFLGPATDNVSVFMNNCIISDNYASGIWLANTPSGVVFTNCSFYKNQGTPITAYQSRFELRGENIFRDNTAERGGALTLYNSTVIFGPRSNIQFINNTAKDFGGAIYIATLSIVSFFRKALIYTENFDNATVNGVLMANTLLKQSCFYLSNSESNITFVDNSASLGGFDIYGATLYTEDCNFVNSKKFRFKSEPVSTYEISSDPTRVCFCPDNTPQCENRTYFMLNETRYPGETFTISVALAGYNFGRVAGSVYTNVMGQDFAEVIDSERQHIQSVNLNECSTLTYAVSSNQTSDSVVLVLTAQEQITQEQDETDIQIDLRNIYSSKCSEHGLFPCTALLTTPVYINVTLEPCPLGFKLKEVCECEDIFQNFTCEIQNHMGYITREGTMWAGVDPNDNDTNIYYWHRYCHTDYCISSPTPIDLRSPDKQCTSNRSGILCGRCQADHSLQLGGNKCAECSNSFLSLLIIVFAALGILLVASIKLLDLTVTSGTISGLIFYANVVWRNNALLFSLKDRQNTGYYIITVPIAWINLDFGIEACFSENLDQLTKTGLQFVFPVYIWCIAIFIIVISHYSTRATKLFGNNSVAVLATLFLLSYGKLFRNITDVFTYADVQNSSGSAHKVWSLDGNVRYGGTPGHIVLIVLALLFLFLFLLPFTLMLLLVPFLRAKSHLRPLHWINTLKPFFDTYYGPFKDKKQHHIWTGILLISRVVILIVYAATSTHTPRANILLMTLIATLLLMYNAMAGLLYKKWTLSLLENIYIVNMIVLGGVFLFSDVNSNYMMNPIASTSVVIALFLFLCTVIICTAKQIVPVERIWMHSKETIKNEGADQPVPRARVEDPVPTIHVIELPKDKYDSTVYRETLLESAH